MKRSFLVMVLLTGFAFWILIAGTGYVNQGKDQVEITEQIRYGDIAEAEGISFYMQTHWNTKLLWDTEYQIGNPAQTKTKFQFCQRGKMASFEVTMPEIVIDVPNQFSMIGVNLFDLQESELPYALIFKEVAERTAAGEGRTEEVFLSDYYVYYPLHFEVQSSKIASVMVSEDAQEMINQRIRIPVLLDHKAEFFVRKNGSGEVEELRYRNLEGGISIQISGVVLDTGCYFSLTCYDSEEQLLDMEFLNAMFLDTARFRSEEQEIQDVQEIQNIEAFQIKYGIYCLPYHWESGERLFGEPYAVLEFENIECVYPLETGGSTVLTLQEEENRFLLLTKEADDVVLRVLKKDTKEILQRIEVLAWEEGEGFQNLKMENNGLLITMRSGKICFLTKDETGFYQKQLDGNFDKIEEGWERNSLILDSVFQWDGERLAVAGFLHGTNSVYLAVFKEEGMVFLGYYQHSGDLDWALGFGGIQPMGKLRLEM